MVIEFPNCWDLELGRSYRTSADENAEDEDEEDEEDEGEGEEARKPEKMSEEAPAPKVVKSSLAYQEFLQFLQLGCSGNPVQGYPTIVIVLSTIPSSVSASLPSCTNRHENIIVDYRIVGNKNASRRSLYISLGST